MDQSIQSDIKHSSLLDSLVLYTKLYHKPYSAEALMAGLPLNYFDNNHVFLEKRMESLFSRAAKRAGLKSALIQRSIDEMLNLQLPIILLLSHNNSCILEEFSKDKSSAKIVYSQGEGPLEEWVKVSDLETEYLGFAFMLKKPYIYKTRETQTISHQNHWFWDSIKESKSIYKDVLLASLLINLFVLATPLFTMNVYDRVIPNNAIETLWVFTIGVVIVYLLDISLKFTRSYMLELAAKKSDVLISSIIFEKVLDLQLNEFPTSVGAFANNIKDFDSIRSFLTNATLTVLIDLPFVVIFLSLIWYLGGSIVIVPIVIIGIILAYSFVIRKPLQQSIESTHLASAHKNGVLIEALQNIETIKAMGLSGKVQYEYEESVGEIANKSLRSRLLSSSVPSITAFFVQFNTIASVFYGVFLISNFELTMGGLIAIIILSSRVVAPLGQAASLISNYEDAKASYTLLNDIVSKPSERPEGKEFIQRKNFLGDIEFKNVSFTYPNSEIPSLNNVSFTIKKNEKVAILGRIGSGKSTVIKLLLKLYEPQSGSILIDGIDIKQIDPADLRKAIGYIPQDIQLFQGTIKDNILNNYRYYSDEEMLFASKTGGVDEFVKRYPLGYEMPIGERGIGLSGGQKQTVGIARALLFNSDVMVFDEPTNGMDLTTELQVVQRLKKVMENKTLLLVTQKMSVLELCDRILVFHDAQKIMDGDKEEIMNKLVLQ